MTNIILPLIVLFIIVYGLIKKVNIYDVFLDGAKESFDMIIKMFPPLLGMIFSVNIFINSGILIKFLNIFSFIFKILKVPIEVVPLALMRPISSTSALAILNNIYESFGVDSYISFLGSIIQGSTDTTFYIITLYFGSVGIKKIRHALWAGLIADLGCIIISIVVARCFFSM